MTFGQIVKECNLGTKAIKTFLIRSRAAGVVETKEVGRWQHNGNPKLLYRLNLSKINITVK